MSDAEDLWWGFLLFVMPFALLAIGLLAIHNVQQIEAQNSVACVSEGGSWDPQQRICLPS